MSAPDPPAPQTIDRLALAALLGVSVRTLDRFRQDRGFPRPLTGRRRRPLWSKAVIERWMSGPS